MRHGRSSLRERTRATRKAAMRGRLYLALALGDMLSILGGMAAASAFRTNEAFSEQTINILAVLLPFFVLLALGNRAYGVEALGDWKLGLRRVLYALMVTAFIVVGIGFAFKVSSEYSRLATGIGVSISALLLVLFRYCVRLAVRWAMAGGLYEEIILCDDPLATIPAGASVVDARALGLSPDFQSPAMLDRLGKALFTADRVLVFCPPERRQAWTLTLKGLGRHVEVLLPEVEQLGVLTISRYHDRATAVVARGPLGARDELVKRLFDLVVVAALSPVMMVVLSAIAIAIKIDDGGPVFFRQTRMGRGNRLFRMYKFRSMRAGDADAEGAVSTRRGDDRVTRVGRLLRSTSMDELPQLLNVVRSEMSLVGPRPHALGSTAADALFWEIDERYWLRHATKPGLTGLAQIRGFRGATATASDVTNRVQADLEYLAGWSLRRDIRILAATVRVVLHPNAY